ncbi:MAG: phenylalanine--tRNA ligase subunit alpha [Candidatus Doudnabacteria bacterium]
MDQSLNKIKEEFEKDLLSVVDNLSLQSVKTRYLGRKEGSVTLLFEDLKNWPLEKKKEFGGALNSLKKEIESALFQKELSLQDKNEAVDLNVPAIKPESGHFHPITLLQKEIEDIFFGMGFDIQLGPEIDSDYYNFEALNIPEDHPSRDMQDTFYMDIEHPKKHPGKNIVLRTHISNMQVRYMEKNKPPFSVILPGRVFRNEALDASHEHTYQYMEGFVVGKNITYANMAWTLEYVMKEIFGKEVETKLLPSYFPFVEPGAEGFVSCVVCKGKGCSVCKQTGWVEILGCGMIHQRVFEAAGYKAGEYTGFAFGFGLSRLALMKYSIPDIRLFAENDLRFLNQF